VNRPKKKNSLSPAKQGPRKIPRLFFVGEIQDICRYGVLDFQTPAGFHTRLHLSKIQSAMNFQYIVSQLIEHANTDSLL
jgi:hypothetical protein